MVSGGVRASAVPSPQICRFVAQRRSSCRAILDGSYRASSQGDFSDHITHRRRVRNSGVSSNRHELLFQSLVPTVYVSVARPRCVNSRLESGELAPVHGTPHEPARGPTHHASDSVLREVLRRHLRVQVRDRARRGANPTVHVCPGFRACASKVVLPRARKMGVSPRRAPASPSRRFRGSRAMNAMGTSVWVL